MFFGEFQHTLDPKGRMNIPAKFREGLGESVYLTKGLDQCLFVFPPDEWGVFEAKLKTLPLTNKNARAFIRHFFAGATECETDKQGRIVIPQNLREHAGLDREAVVIGVGTRVEIWSNENWNAYNQDDSLNYEAIAEHMAELGI